MSSTVNIQRQSLVHVISRKLISVRGRESVELRSVSHNTEFPVNIYCRQISAIGLVNSSGNALN